MVLTLRRAARRLARLLYPADARLALDDLAANIAAETARISRAQARRAQYLRERDALTALIDRSRA